MTRTMQVAMGLEVYKHTVVALEEVFFVCVFITLEVCVVGLAASFRLVSLRWVQLGDPGNGEE